MAVSRWTPPIEPSPGEARILKRVSKKRKLFGFLRSHRHGLFSDGFQEELEATYRATGAGKTRIPPARMAMALLLQAYSDASDSEAVELAFSRADCVSGALRHLETQKPSEGRWGARNIRSRETIMNRDTSPFVTLAIATVLGLQERSVLKKRSGPQLARPSPLPVGTPLSTQGRSGRPCAR